MFVLTADWRLGGWRCWMIVWRQCFMLVSWLDSDRLQWIDWWIEIGDCTYSHHVTSLRQFGLISARENRAVGFSRLWESSVISLWLIAWNCNLENRNSGFDCCDPFKWLKSYVMSLTSFLKILLRICIQHWDTHTHTYTYVYVYFYINNLSVYFQNLEMMQLKFASKMLCSFLVLFK